MATKTKTKPKARAKPKSANKTQPTRASVKTFLDALPDKPTRDACKVLSRMMRHATGKRAKMWGESIVGFGEYHYRYDSGREGDFMVVGFSPRKQNLSIYIINGFDKYRGLLKKLGKHKTNLRETAA